jgi:hypothetical protein
MENTKKGTGGPGKGGWYENTLIARPDEFKRVLNTFKRVSRIKPGSRIVPGWGGF